MKPQYDLFIKTTVIISCNEGDPVIGFAKDDFNIPSWIDDVKEINLGEYIMVENISIKNNGNDTSMS